MRFHDLDALRATAMLLGILLHAALSFIDLPIWPAQDINANDAVFGIFNDAIHGFRMPLFFLVSGFFTAMLANKRGLRALAKHRTKRVLLPLVIGWFVFGVPIYIIAAYGAYNKSQSPTDNTPQAEAGSRSQKTDSPPLLEATLAGDTGRVRALLESGADVSTTGPDGNQPLHTAAFLGHADITRLLLEHDADPEAKNNKGDTPLASAHAPWWLTERIGGMLQIELDRETIESGRTEIILLLMEHGATPIDPGASDSAGLTAFFALLAFMPLFHHLWFLYYLLWLVATYILLTKSLRKISAPRLPDVLLSTPGCLVWLVPLTLLPQSAMKMGFGPDTASGLLPWPPIIGYYAIFFFFGAACFGRTVFHDKAGRLWPLYLIACIPLLLVGTGVIDIGDNHLLYSLVAAAYAWLMTFASIGLFRQFFHSENRHLRYISDASYWLYLAHLPLVMALQIIVARWDIPAWIKFTGICALTYAVLILIYEYAIRYTWAGTLLNGKKVRIPKLPTTQ